MLELHNFFLNNLNKFWKFARYDIYGIQKSELRQGIAALIEMIDSRAYDINAQDKDGNTLLHLILNPTFDDLDYTFVNEPDKPINNLIAAVLKNGGRINIRNNDNMTAIDVHFTNESKSIRTWHLLWVIKEVCPTDTYLIPVLDGIIKKNPYADLTSKLIYWNELSLETSKSLLQWSKKIAHTENVKIFRELMQGQLLLLEKAFDLPKIIAEISDEESENRDIFMRAMLIGGDYPLTLYLNEIVNEQVYPKLPAQLRCVFEKFIEAYEENRQRLESLSAIPTPLTEAELKIVKPVCEKLQNILYELQNPEKDAAWRKRVAGYEESPQQRMEKRYVENYEQYAPNHKKLMDELSRNKFYIQDNKFLCTNGMFAKNRLRNQLADAAEKRLHANENTHSGENFVAKLSH